MKLDYNYGGASNNGNVLSQKVTVNRPSPSPLVFDQTYTYDSLNRLKSAEEISNSVTTWKQVYNFDRYGNRNFDEEETTTLTKNCVESSQPVVCLADRKVINPEFNLTNNRMASGQDWTYDAAGNITVDAEGKQFFYDAENKQKEVKNALNETIGQYFFDGDGMRVKKVVPDTGEVTIFVYDAGGKLIGEYSTQISQSPKVQYLTNDHLGSPRIITDENGDITSRTDYMPYGEEIVGLGGRSPSDHYATNDVRQGFTGYERDNETGLDFAEARYYNNFHGRFTAADPLLASGRSANPQTFNRYVYVANNPTTLTDPTGLDPDCQRNGQGCGELPHQSEYIEEPEAPHEQAIIIDYDIPEDAMCNPTHPYWDYLNSPQQNNTVSPNDPNVISDNLALTESFTSGTGVVVTNRPQTETFYDGGQTHFRYPNGQIVTIHILGDSSGTGEANVYAPPGFDVTYSGGRSNTIVAHNRRTNEYITYLHISGPTSQASLNRNLRTRNNAGWRLIGQTGGPGGEYPTNRHSCVKIYSSPANYNRARVQYQSGDVERRLWGDFRSFIRK